MILDPKDEIDLPLEPIKEKLSAFWPKSVVGNYSHEFADFLSTQLRGDTICPSQFLMEIELAFSNLKCGKDRDGQMIKHHAVDRVPTVEIFIRRDIPSLVAEVFPTEFAAQVSVIMEEVRTSTPG
ncbi:MAG: hypothetical protein JWL87_495 [Candidatus Adlerbacteria bacterium]|nr:hypothetical protein [Candidatus Adlerbacteria bacterium]